MRGKLMWGRMIGGFMAFLFGTAMPVSAQVCTWSTGVIPSVSAPTSTPLRAYKDLLRSPGRLGVDKSGKVYITDPPSGRVFVRDAYGRTVDTIIGFAGPLGIAVDAFGSIYVAEEKTGSVTLFDPAWNPILKLGQGDGEFVLPNHIAIDSVTGFVYVTDSSANVVKVFSPDGTPRFSFGSAGLPAEFNFPTGIFVSSAGEVFVADQNNNNRIQVFDLQGRFLRCFLFGKKSMMGSTYKLGRIQGITGDTNGRLYVADTFQGFVQVFDALGADVSTIGSFGDGPGQLQSPVSLAIDRFNRLFVASVGNTRVDVFGLDNFSDPKVLQAIIELRPTQFERILWDKKTLSAYIEVPGATPDRINMSTVTANDVPPEKQGVDIVDYDGDGILELRLKFNIDTLLTTLPDGEGIVTVGGQLVDGTPFEASVVVTVLPTTGG